MKTLDWIFERSIPEPNTGCWLWLGDSHALGYGLMRVKRSDGSWGRGYVHRLALELKIGRPLGDGHACHTCDTPSCVNPNHLYVGDAKSNARDRESRGRGRRPNTGFEVPKKLASVGYDAVAELVRSGVPQRDVAARLGVTPGRIGQVARGRGVTRGPRLKFSSDDISRLLRLRSEGKTYTQISDELGISRQHACDIINGKYRASPNFSPDEE